MGHKILLTGGLGYIGSHVYVELISLGYDVVLLDNLINSKVSVCDRLEQITGVATQFIKADVLSPEQLTDVFQEHKFDAVVHFAGLKAVGESVEKPLNYFQTNITGLLNVLDAMQASEVDAIVFSSSATVYQSDLPSPLTEGMQLGFNNPYGFTKKTCEEILEQARHAVPNIKTGVLRYFNPAGAHSSGLIGEDPNDIPNNLFPYIQGVATGRFDHLRVFGQDYDTHDGTGVRDYVHVVDLAKGHVASVKALLETSKSHVVNLGRGQGASVLDVLEAYSGASGKNLPYKIYPRREGDLATTFADVSRAKEILNFEATHTIADMCASSWKWVTTAAKLD